MKRYYYRPEPRNNSHVLFYVTLEEVMDSMQQRMVTPPRAQSHLTLVVNREPHVSVVV